MQRSAELEDLGRREIDAMMNGDGADLANHLDDDDNLLFIGSDPDEWWQGRDAILRAVEVQSAEMAGKVTLQVNDSTSGADTSWGWAAFTCTIKGSGEETAFRVTTVHRRVLDGWKLVHGHASVAVPNEESIGVELTI